MQVKSDPGPGDWTGGPRVGSLDTGRGGFIFNTRFFFREHMLYSRHFRNLVLLVLCVASSVAASGADAGKGTPASKASSPESQVPVMRLHWQGRKNFSTQTNMASLMRLWHLPESNRLEKQ